MYSFICPVALDLKVHAFDINVTFVYSNHFFFQKKVLNVSPLTRSQESPEHCNTSGKQSAAGLMDDVYNHLNEIKETVTENTYDHACAVSAKSQNKDLDDYSYLRGINGNTVVSGGTGDDNYSTLEHY